MASTIAAITTGIGGIVTTADATGNLSLLSGTSTVVAVTSAGAAVTGTMSVSGATTLTGGLNTPLAVTSGGTGVATSTGTGANVLGTSPTLTTPTFDSASLVTISGTAPLYMCRAWVNFNGTGTVAIRASGNVSSITDNGTGDYTVNFTTAMPDANYQINTSIGVLSTGSGGVAGVYTSATVPTASLCRVFSVGNSTDTITDTAYFYVSIFR